MPRQESRQARQQHGARQVAYDIDPQQPGHRPARTLIGILHVGEDCHAASVVRLTLDGRLDVACGALQEAHAEPLFQRLDRGSRQGLRQAEV